jgi:phage/conjugal plasmid C-4 type zinc finger TraR family protein
MAGGYFGSDAYSETALAFSEGAVDLVKKVLARQQVRESSYECKNPECGEDIPEARRQAVPGVQFCVSCASKIQRR